MNGIRRQWFCRHSVCIMFSTGVTLFFFFVLMGTTAVWSRKNRPVIQWLSLSPPPTPPVSLSLSSAPSSAYHHHRSHHRSRGYPITRRPTTPKYIRSFHGHRFPYNRLRLSLSAKASRMIISYHITDFIFRFRSWDITYPYRLTRSERGVLV